jgi:hypothetical protein
MTFGRITKLFKQNIINSKKLKGKTGRRTKSSAGRPAW